MDSVAGRVHVAYTSNPNAADQWISKYAHEALHGSWQRFGLDAEYRGAAGGHAISRIQCEYTSPDGPDSSDAQPDPRKSSHETMKLKSLKRVPVHTVQLAVQRPEGAKAPYEVLVYHMASNLSGTKNGKVIVSKNLARLLASNYAEFVGVAIGDDVKRLDAVGLPVGGAKVVDTAVLGNRVLGITTGLARLGRVMLGVPPWKSKKLAMSDWKKYPLSSAALQYAAKDALYSLQVHEALLLAAGEDPGDFSKYSGRHGGGTKQVLEQDSSEAGMQRAGARIHEWQHSWRQALAYTARQDPFVELAGNGRR